jgi:uncharacterized lipoprotein YddW (UPF0748 family)
MIKTPWRFLKKAFVKVLLLTLSLLLVIYFIVPDYRPSTYNTSKSVGVWLSNLGSPFFITPQLLNSFVQEAKEHPDWIIGEVKDTSLLEEFKAHLFGNPVYLNICNPEVQNFLESLLLDLANVENIDGIQIDDNWSVSLDVVKKYNLDAQEVSSCINQFTARAIQSIKLSKPNLYLSMAGNNPDYSKANYLQDWESWLSQGWLDEVVLQNYFSDLDKFKHELDILSQLRAKYPNVTYKVGLLSGTALRQVNNTLLKDQINLVKDYSFEHLVFFYQETLYGFWSQGKRYKRKGFVKEMIQNFKS